MKKILTAIMASALMLSCGKIVQVSVDHPVSVDVEPDERSAAMDAAWIDVAGNDLARNALDSYMKDFDGGMAICMADASFAGGAAAWFSAHKAAWGENSVICECGDRCIFATAAKGVALSAIKVNEKDVIELASGDFHIYAACLQTADVTSMLETTWYKGASERVIYILQADDMPVMLQDATFTECLRGQFGAAALPKGWNDYLYTSAGTWNCLSGLSCGSLESDGKTFKVEFTINAEEGRI